MSLLFLSFNLNHHFYAFQDLNVDDGGVREIDMLRARKTDGGNVRTERSGVTWSPTPTGTTLHDDDVKQHKYQVMLNETFATF